MLISEIFLSIQGESTYVGMPCIFVRLAGCNLACSWCDTPYARSAENSREMTIEEILGEVKNSSRGSSRLRAESLSYRRKQRSF